MEIYFRGLKFDLAFDPENKINQVLGELLGETISKATSFEETSHGSIGYYYENEYAKWKGRTSRSTRRRRARNNGMPNFLSKDLGPEFGYALLKSKGMSELFPTSIQSPIQYLVMNLRSIESLFYYKYSFFQLLDSQNIIESEEKHAL